jgi:hypothetical protein
MLHCAENRRTDFLRTTGGSNTGRKRQSGYGSDCPLISHPVREHTGYNRHSR